MVTDPPTRWTAGSTSVTTARLAGWAVAIRAQRSVSSKYRKYRSSNCTSRRISASTDMVAPDTQRSCSGHIPTGLVSDAAWVVPHDPPTAWSRFRRRPPRGASRPRWSPVRHVAAGPGYGLATTVRRPSASIRGMVTISSLSGVCSALQWASPRTTSGLQRTTRSVSTCGSPNMTPCPNPRFRPGWRWTTSGCPRTAGGARQLSLWTTRTGTLAGTQDRSRVSRPYVTKSAVTFRVAPWGAWVVPLGSFSITRIVWLAGARRPRQRASSAWLGGSRGEERPVFSQ